MKKILFILLSLIFVVGCNKSNESKIEESQTKNEQPQTKIITSDNIQYNIKWNSYDNPVDIRIVTLSKDGESHDYVVANNYIGRAGGLDIDHWPGCKCMKDSIK